MANKKEESLKNTSVLAILMKPKDRRQFNEYAIKMGTNASNLGRVILCDWMSRRAKNELKTD